MSTLSLQTKLGVLNNIGPKTVPLLQKIGLETCHDCFYFFPREYDDRRQLPTIASCQSGTIQTVSVVIERVTEKQVKKGMHIIEAIVSDRSGHMTAIWFNQAYLLRQLYPGTRIIIKGKVEQTLFLQSSQIQVQQCEIIRSNQELNESIGVVVPVYALTAGLFQTQVRNLIKEVFKLTHHLIDDRLPAYLIQALQLLPLQKAIKDIHFPSNVEAYKKARQRVVFDEFLIYQCRLENQRMHYKQTAKTQPLQVQGPLSEQYTKTLPYTLTKAQQRVIAEIQEDLSKDTAMNRLLQGDVGAGKTDVAILMLLSAVDSQKKGMIMAPTEILASQHYARMSAFLTPLNIPCYLLKSKLKKKEKEQIVQNIQSQEPCIIIGTHALLQDYVSLDSCGAIVIDEQHRFGVIQRIQLQKKGHHPHCLFMTATPIPRSFMLTCFGDLDKSIIDELPPGRHPAKTQIVEEQYIGYVYQNCLKRLQNNEQIFMVYPLVDESEKMDLKSAIEGHETIQKTFPECSVALIHGRMKAQEKDEIMTQFKENKIQILVSTTVIEVGIDVPNASVMIIQHAERFGLSQLHQLRGRIGRGGQQSYCYLITNSKSELARQRLTAMAQTTDGFEIAELDLKIRGPGDLLGTKQAGVPDFYLADLIQDEKVLLLARKVAKKVMNQDPHLENPEHAGIKQYLQSAQDTLIGRHLN